MLNGSISASVNLFGLQTNATVFFNSNTGVQLILVNIRYQDQFAQASADLVYNVACANDVRTQGDAALVLHGIADGDLSALCAVQLFSGCAGEKQWALQCSFDGQSISIIFVIFHIRRVFD